jgi:CheY-like chemotaxis protein/HPt (histidine-containing phosphotransfer) domain-containing protein
MQMPGMDGLMLAIEICKVRTVQALPLVMLTSLSQREHYDQNAQVEFAAFLTKPVKPAHLYNVLVGVFEGQPAKIKPDLIRSSSLDRQLGQHRPLRILLAEDNVINQKVALLILERIGYRADIAANGLEVLQALQRQAYDVVLMDMQMPEMDGLEATRFIGENWSNEQRPWIIAMTANALQGDRERCLEAGMNDYVSKPVRPEELAQALARYQARSEPIETEVVAVQSLGGVEAKRNGNETQLNLSVPVLEASILTELRELLGDQAPQMMVELIDLYFETAPPLLKEMRTAINQEDGPTLYRAAHTLKPGSASLGAVCLARLCEELETIGKIGHLEGAGPKLAELEAKFAQVKIALEAEKRGSYN